MSRAPTHPSLKGDGHDEQRWRSWSAPRRWPTAALPSGDRVLVVTPHPDDAVLAVGGLLHLLARRHNVMTLLAVTDGEASHPRSPTHSAEDLRARRIAETRTAFAVLDVPLVGHRRLHLPDGAVADHTGTVGQAVTAQVAAAGAALVLAPWWRDGHPDHDATGRAVRRSLAALPGVVAWYFPVWAWHWADPGDLTRAWPGAHRVDLPPSVQQVKSRAVAAHRSQLGPLSDAPGDEAIVPAAIRARFERPWETVLL